MDSQNSYEAKVRALARAKARQEHAFFLSLFAKLTLDEAIVTRKAKLLAEQIDAALERGDRKAFMALSKEYAELVR